MVFKAVIGIVLGNAIGIVEIDVLEIERLSRCTGARQDNKYKDKNESHRKRTIYFIKNLFQRQLLHGHPGH